MTDHTGIKTTWSAEEVTDGGERVTHLYPNDCYYAHLSIYYFALQFCQGGLVLDAGSGAGYGSAYLADHGARFIWGCELSEKAVAFSQHHFQRSNLRYCVADLQNITEFPPRNFDLIYSSNVLEHVPDVLAFLRTAWQLLKQDGVMVVAVPPIVRDVDWTENIANIYHLNIWTPRQWFHVVSLFFEEIQPYWLGFNKPGFTLDFSHTPEQCRVDEKDFIYNPAPLEEYYQNPSLGVIFVVRKPRSKSELPDSAMPLTFVENSFTRSPVFSKDLSAPAKAQFRFYSSLKRLFDRSRMVAREQGYGAVLHKTYAFLQRKLENYRRLLKFKGGG